MSSHLDSVPFSGIIRIRDMMYGVRDPFRLDQGDVSFDAPDTLKAAMRAAIDDNRTHYVQTTGLPRLLELLAEKLRRVNGIPVGSARRSHGHQRRHPRAVPRVPGAARAGRRGHHPGSGVAAVRRATSPRRARVPVPCPLHEASRLALRSRRARVEDHAADARDLHQLAAQPDRRRADARATSRRSPRSPASTTSG